MSRVASEASIVPSHHHGLSPRRQAAAEAKSTPFAMLLDDAGEAPSPPERPERARPGSAGNTQPDTNARRGRENDRCESTETEQTTAPADVMAIEVTTEDNAVAQLTAEDNAVAQLTAEDNAVAQLTAEENAVAEATAAEADAADEIGDEEQPVSADMVEVLAVEIDTPPPPPPPPVSTEPAPVPAVPGVRLPAAEAASDATGTDVAASDRTTVEAAAALGEPVAGAAKTREETKEQAGRKATTGSTAPNGTKPLDAKRSAAAEGDAPAPTEAAASDDEDSAPAAPKTTDRGEHASARANHASRAAGHEAAPKPVAESSTRPPIEPQIGATADKPSADVVQLVTLQQPAERTGGANSVVPSAAPADAADQPVPIAGLALEIAARVQSGRSRFEIRLDPPELGRIDVRLDVDRSGQVTSRLVVDKAETLDLLRRDAPELERALQQAGLKTGDNGLQFALRDQTGGQNQADWARSGTARVVVADPEMVETETSGYGRSPRLGGGIDIRV